MLGGVVAGVVWGPGVVRDLATRVSDEDALVELRLDGAVATLVAPAGWAVTQYPVSRDTGELRSPDVSHCQPGCGNIARTDHNIDQVRAAINRHEAEIASATTPIPLRVRLEQRITALQAIVDEHHNKAKP